MRDASSLDFISDDQTFGIRIEYREVLQMLEICKLAKNEEVGGIIIGRYDLEHRYALVKFISHAPSDSIKSRFWFQRGIRGLQNLLDHYWNKRRYFYLGEWHFHPGNSTQASSLDVEQMTAIATSKKYNCPEPILLICGRDPSNTWEISAYVFLRNKTWIKLREISK